MSHGILLIEDETDLADNIKSHLEDHGCEVRCAETAEAGFDLFSSFVPDLVLLDFKLPGMNGLEAIKRLLTLDPAIKIVLITAHGSIQIAVDAMKAGAWDYVGKPLVLSELKRLIDKAVSQDKIESALSYYTRRDASKGGLDAIVGPSPAVQKLKADVQRLLEIERATPNRPASPVLIVGATGTGKQLVARALHFSSIRHRYPFIELNCAALPEQLVEDELFGHERGAFTDAKSRKLGLVEAADRGTLFLDEISEIPTSTQAKLLKLIENRKVRRVGGLRERTVNVRFVAATNQSLEDLVREGKFRADLYFRLRTIQLETPRLREHRDDILPLAQHFLTTLCTRYRRPELHLSPAAETAMTRHAWPGNVRELEHAIEQAVLLTTGSTIEPEHLAFSGLDAPTTPSQPHAPHTDGSGYTLCESGIDLEAVERSFVEQALERTYWNTSAAARLLNVSRDMLRYRIEKYGLRRGI